jgi:hypothetical protein
VTGGKLITALDFTQYSYGISDIHQRHPHFAKIAMRNTAEVTGGKPITTLDFTQYSNFY